MPTPGGIRVNDRKTGRLVWGVLFLVLGVVFLLQNFGLISEIHLGRWWPVLLVAAGAAIVIRNRLR